MPPPLYSGGTEDGRSVPPTSARINLYVLRTFLAQEHGRQLLYMTPGLRPWREEVGGGYHHMLRVYQGRTKEHTFTHTRGIIHETPRLCRCPRLRSPPTDTKANSVNSHIKRAI